MSREPENLVLRALRDIRADVAGTKAELKSEMRSLRADVASVILTVNAKIDATRKDLSDQIMGLRRAVVDYHSVVIGHGVLIRELEARLRRVEQHLNLAAGDAH
jgi:signal transduction histidine kinase